MIMRTAVQGGPSSVYPVTTEAYQSILSVSKGKRPVSPLLADVDGADLVGPGRGPYLHWGAGQFAVIYRCRTSSGHDLALRCPLLPPSQDAAERCEALGRHFCQASWAAPYFVQFRFIPDAVYVKSAWLPVYEMEWVEGVDLGEFVRDRIRQDDRASLDLLAREWLLMLLRLQADGIAHGDLQHGNVLVTLSKSGAPRLRLVDYDTVYVPDLCGRTLNTTGLPGYTHPAYLSGQERPYGREMDTFGGVVILLSLYALAHDPSLYGRFSQENLLLSDIDLEHPHHSPAFLELLAMKDAVIPFLASILEQMCQNASLSNVLLESILKQDRTPDILASMCSTWQEEAFVEPDAVESHTGSARLHAPHIPWTETKTARRLFLTLLVVTLFVAVIVLLVLIFVGKYLPYWRQHIVSSRLLINLWSYQFVR